MADVNTELLDSAVRHSVDLTRYSNGTVRKIIALLNRSDADLVDQIRNLDADTLTSARLERLLDEVRRINRDAYGLVEKELTDELAALADYEAGFQVRSIQSALPIEMAVIQPTAAQVYAATMARPFQGDLLSGWFGNLRQSAQKKIDGAIRMGFIEGETIDQMVRRIRGTRARNYADGVLQINRRNAESVVRTAVTHTANVARQETYAQNADLVDKVRWVATLDGRTTLVCMGRDGVTYPTDSGPRPPAHFGCRSTTIPVVKSWRELGFDIDELDPATRASMNGQVPAKQTYNDWLKTQSDEFQDEVLGKERADLFRGGVGVDKFTDASGRSYTLDELRARETAAQQKPTPKTATPAERRAAIWATKTAAERDGVAVAFADADPDRMAIIQAAGNLYGGVKRGKGSHHSGDTMTVQMASGHTGESYNRVMRHEYGHHIDASIEQKMMQANGVSLVKQRYAMGPSRLAREELKADAIALENAVSGEARNVWIGSPPKVTPGMREKVDKQALALLDKYRGATDDAARAASIRSDFEQRGIDLDEARAIFSHMFGADDSLGAAKFIAAFDSNDHVALVYGGGAKMMHDSPLAGLSDSLGAATNQRIGYQFGHPKTYYAKFRSYDKSAAGLLGDQDPFGRGSRSPTGGKYAYGSGNTAQLWANWFEAYMSGNKTQYAVFSRMFPATSARFERIVEAFAKDGTVQ